MKKKITIISAIVIACIPVLLLLCIYLSPLNRTLYNDADDFSDEIGTVWESANPEIRLEVYEEEGPKGFKYGQVRGTMENDGKTINIGWNSLRSEVMIYDIRKLEQGCTTSETELFYGECDLSRNKMKIEIISSNTDEVKATDEIILHKIN